MSLLYFKDVQLLSSWGPLCCTGWKWKLEEGVGRLEIPAAAGAIVGVVPGQKTMGPELTAHGLLCFLPSVSSDISPPKITSWETTCGFLVSYNCPGVLSQLLFQACHLGIMPELSCVMKTSWSLLPSRCPSKDPSLLTLGLLSRLILLPAIS